MSVGNNTSHQEENTQEIVVYKGREEGESIDFYQEEGKQARNGKDSPKTTPTLTLKITSHITNRREEERKILRIKGEKKNEPNAGQGEGGGSQTGP